MELVLASSSKYRRHLLERLGVPFRWRSPLVDEESLKNPALAPRELAEFLAEAKAASLSAEEPQAAILGGDQLVACEGRILGKPGSLEAAERQLATLAGRSHQLITAVCIRSPDRLLRHVDVTTLQMRSLTPAEIARYVAADEPSDCAGAYKLEQRGVALFESIESADHSAITGLPLIAVSRMLRSLGFAVP